MSLRNIIFSFLFLLPSFIANAADNAVSPWKSMAELGYVSVSGNTNTETIKAVFDISYEVDRWKQKFHADALSATNTTTDTGVSPPLDVEERTAAKWLASTQTDYKFSKLDYLLGLVSYEDDRFSGFEYKAKLFVGYGRKVIGTEKHELKLEIGPGYRKYRLEQVLPPATPVNTDTQTDSLIRLNANYEWKISDTSLFAEEFTAEFGGEQDETKSVTTLSANINSSLAMKLSYTVKRLDEVPEGKKNTDREAAVTLVFKY